MIGLGYGLAWLSTSLAVCMGIHVSHNIHCIWFMLIPACISIKSSTESKSNKNKEEEIDT